MRQPLSDKEVEDIFQRPMLYLGDDVAELEAPPAVVAFVYAVRSLDLVKIGITTTIASRIQGLRNMSAASVTLLFSFPFRNYREAWRAEQLMHLKFASRRHHGEWFTLSEADLEDLRTAIGTCEGAIDHGGASV